MKVLPSYLSCHYKINESLERTKQAKVLLDLEKEVKQKVSLDVTFDLPLSVGGLHNALDCRVCQALMQDAKLLAQSRDAFNQISNCGYKYRASFMCQAMVSMFGSCVQDTIYCLRESHRCQRFLKMEVRNTTRRAFLTIDVLAWHQFAVHYLSNKVRSLRFLCRKLAKLSVRQRK